MRLTKTLLMTAAAAVLGSQALAGGFAPIVVDPEPIVVVEPDAPRSTFGILLPLALLGGLVALAVAAEGDDDEDDTDETEDGGDGDGDGTFDEDDEFTND